MSTEYANMNIQYFIFLGQINFSVILNILISSFLFDDAGTKHVEILHNNITLKTTAQTRSMVLAHFTVKLHASFHIKAKRLHKDFMVFSK